MSTKGTIVVIDDSEIDLAKTVKTLSDVGHEVNSSTSTQEGLGLALAFDHDLLIISLTLMDQDGLRLCSQIRSHDKTRQTPILLMADDAAQRLITELGRSSP